MYPPAYAGDFRHGAAPRYGAGGFEPQRRAPDDDGRSWSLPRVALMVVGLAVVIIGGALFALSMMSADFVRDRLVAAVKEKTGRDLVVAGSSSFKIFPSVGVALENVSLSAPPGMTGAPPVVTMSALDVSVSLLPLLQRDLRINSLVLREPEFNLAVDAGGRKSWHFADTGGPVAASHPIRLAQAGGTASDAPGGLPSDAAQTGAPSRLRLSQLRLDDVRIDNGTVHYSDARTGSRHEMKGLNVQLALPAITEPLTAKGDMMWNGKPVNFEGALTSVSSVIDDRPAKLRIALSSDVLLSSFEGSASFRDTMDLEGIVSAQSPSVRTLAHWIGVALPPSKGFGPLTAKGLYRSNGKAWTLSSAEIALDGTTAHGQITVEMGGPRPRINANLKLTELDLNTYRRDGAPDSNEPQPAHEGKPAESGASGGASSIDDLLAREPAPAGPRVKGYTHREGWSDEPYDFSLMGLVDADAKLSVSRLFFRDIKIGQTELTVALKNRVMKTTIDDMRLYDGRGRGAIVLDGSQRDAANVNANITLENISGEPLLKDAADIDKLAGRGRLAFALAGQGQNERQLVETLNGRIEASFADGAIVGINIPQMIRGIGQGRFSAGTAPTDKTDFSEMTSTWTVTNGVAQNQDLRLVSPLMRLTGSGSVMLPGRELDYTLKPKIVASLEGQGGDHNASGIEIPVRVTGPWEKPKFQPDLKGVLRDPKTTETIKEIGKQFKGKSAGEIANDLLGDSPDGQSAKAKAKDLLRQFMGPQ